MNWEALLITLGIFAVIVGAIYMAVTNFVCLLIVTVLISVFVLLCAFFVVYCEIEKMLRKK